MIPKPLKLDVDQPSLVLADLHLPAAGSMQPWRRFLTGAHTADTLIAEIKEQLGSLPRTLIGVGDFGSVQASQQISERFANSIQIYGNGDDRVLRKSLPMALELQLGEAKILLTHGWGSPRYIIDRIVKRFSWEWEGVIYGHTHRPLATVFEKVLCMNPGSATDRKVAKQRTFGLVGAPGTTKVSEQAEANMIGRNCVNGIEFAVFRLGADEK